MTLSLPLPRAALWSWCWGTGLKERWEELGVCGLPRSRRRVSPLCLSPQKRRRPTLGVQLDDKRKEMLKRHPLSVTIDLKCKGKRALVACGRWHVRMGDSRSGSNLAAAWGPRRQLGVRRGFPALGPAAPAGRSVTSRGH